MAISDEDRARRTDDYIDTDLAREANPVTMIAVVLLGFVLAALAGWYVFGKDTAGSVGATRTSAPVSSSPTPGPNTTTVPKQP
jgi:hypothetical protein